MKINNSRLLYINYIYLLILEVVFKVFIFDSLNVNFLYLLLFNFPITIIFTILTSLFKNNKINKAINILGWIGLFIIFLAEIIYYSFYSYF